MAEKPVKDAIFTISSEVLTDEERRVSARQLASELRSAGHDVTLVAQDPALVPEGAKAGVPLELASAFAVGVTGMAIQEVVRYTWMWLRQRKNPQKLKLNITDHQFEITGAMSAGELQTLVETLQAVQRSITPSQLPDPTGDV